MAERSVVKVLSQFDASVTVTVNVPADKEARSSVVAASDHRYLLRVVDAVQAV